MINEYQITIDSNDAISEMLAEAKRRGISYDYYNACIYLRGASGTSIEVGKELRGLYVVATGPAVVHVRENDSIIAEDSATVHAYDRATVAVNMEASVYVASDDVAVESWGDSTKVYLPAEGSAGANPHLRVEGDAKVIIRVTDSAADKN